MPKNLWSSFLHYATGKERIVEIELGVDCPKERSERPVGGRTALLPTLRKKREGWGTLKVAVN